MSAGSEGIGRDEMLAQIRAERERLEAVLARVPADRLAEPGVESDWSVKDLMAHIAAWENQMIVWIETALQGAVPFDQPLTDARIDAMNLAFYEAARRRPLSEVQTAFADSFARAVRLVADIPEADLMDPDRFAWREGRPLWYMVGGNTFWHYRDHREAVEAWLGSDGPVAPNPPEDNNA